MFWAGSKRFPSAIDFDDKQEVKKKCIILIHPTPMHTNTCMRATVLQMVMFRSNNVYHH